VATDEVTSANANPHVPNENQGRKPGGRDPVGGDGDTGVQEWHCVFDLALDAAQRMRHRPSRREPGSKGLRLGSDPTLPAHVGAHGLRWQAMAALTGSTYPTHAGRFIS